MAAEEAPPRLLLVGLACIDIVATVPSYPEEDTDVRCSAVEKTRGGNATNSAAVAAQLGVDCSWMGTITDPDADVDARFVFDNLASFGVHTQHAVRVAEGAVPTSYITLSAATGSRTIVHHRDLPELSYDAFFRSLIAAGSAPPSEDTLADAGARRKALSGWSWMHFEGRHVAAMTKVVRELADSREPGSPAPSGLVRSWREATPVISVELEKPHDGAEGMAAAADVVFVSKEFGAARGKSSPEEVLEWAATFAAPGALLVCAWGERGAWALDKAESGGGKLSHSDAVSPERVVDTLAAGDTFNGAFITALCKHRLGVPSALRFACAVAGAKVGQMGLRLHEDDIDAALKLVTSTEM